MVTSVTPDDSGASAPESPGVLITVLLPNGASNWTAEGSDEALLLQDESMNLGIIGSLEQFHHLIDGIQAAIIAHRMESYRNRESSHANRAEEPSP